jgi:hypothetical protein
MAVPTLNYIRIRNLEYQGAKTETVKMEFLRSAGSYIRKDQIRNIKIREELNIFNLHNKILKSDTDTDNWSVWYRETVIITV